MRQLLLSKQNYAVLFCLILTSYSSLVYASPIKQYKGDLSFRFQDIEGSIGGVTGNRYLTDFNFTYNYRKPFVDKEAKIDLSMRYNDIGGLMYSLKEAQMTYLWENSEFSFGRMNLDWVEIDKVWGLGKINNRVNFDFFEPGQEGLFGIRYKYSFSNWLMADVFLSPMQVPETNPALKINKSKGTIESKNPWVESPKTELSLEDGTKYYVRYNVKEPSISDVIFQGSYGLNLRLSPTEFIHFTSFYIKKPENTLSNIAQMTLGSDFNIDADVYPEVYRHQLYGGQLTVKLFEKSLDIYASYYVSIPAEKPSVDQDFENYDLGLAFEIDKQEEKYFGAGFKWSLTDKLVFSSSYLSLISDYVRTSILSKKPRWSQAVNFAVSYFMNDSWLIEADTKYDTLTFDRLYMMKISWQTTENLKLALGAQIIGTPDNSESYWAPFRKNDAAYVMVAYGL